MENKETNEELKKEQPSLELQISEDQLQKIKDCEVLKINGMEFISRAKTTEMLIKFANEQLKEKELNYGLQEIELNNTKKLLESCEKALEERDLKIKEKEEEMEILKSLLHASERFRIEDASSSIDDRNILHARYMECVKQLTKANEMNERLEKYIQEWLSVCEKTSKQVLDKYQSIKLCNTTATLLTIKEFITEYQNSKK